MPANTKQIKYDVDKKPSPQYFDPELDEYGYLYGANGASRHIIYGADGQPITTDGNKLAVRATEIETQLTAIQGYIDGIEGTLATLATASNQAAIAGYIDQVEAQLTAIQGYVDGLEGAIGQAVADPAVNTLLARVKNLETKLTAIIAGTSPAVVQLSGSKMELYGASLDDRPAATAVSIGTTFTIVDETQNFKTWMSNGTNWGEEI